MKTMTARTTIKKVGQRFVDEPVLYFPKKEAYRSHVDYAVHCAFNDPRTFEQPKPVTAGHERVRLRWMEPDGQGGLRPKRNFA